MKYVSLSYINNTSEEIQKVLEKHKLKLTHKPNEDSRKIFSNFQTKLETKNKTDVLYKIKCNEGTYIGQTTYLFKWCQL